MERCNMMPPELYHHQKEALEVAKDHLGFALFCEQGTGKSAIIIHEIVNLIEQDKINCAIIIAPNNVHVNWKEQFEIHGPPNYDKWAIQIWRSGAPLEKKEAETRAILNAQKVLIFLMNIEALSSSGGKHYLRRILLARRRVYMAIDESHKIKSPTAIRTKACIELGSLAYIRRIATGTEAEEGLENLWSQFKFLDPNIIGNRTFHSFRSMYCVMGGYENREIKGYQNQEILARKIAPYAYQKRKKDCLDLPDKIYVTHQIDMTKEQETIYNKLKEELLYELSNGAIVDATMAMTRMLRLQQVLCGHVNTSEPIDIRQTEYIPSNRAGYVTEIVSNASGKVIVFCRFIIDVELVVTDLAKQGIKSIGISSLVEASRRMGEIDRWRQEKDIKVLAITTATGGTGLTLNEASNTIFYSNSWSSTDRIQAEDRNHRIGQNNKVTYHDIIVPGAIDHRLLYVLRNKQRASNSFRNVVEIQRFLTDPI
jgi:Mesyanzhinovviridae DNA helicase